MEKETRKSCKKRRSGEEVLMNNDSQRQVWPAERVIGWTILRL